MMNMRLSRRAGVAFGLALALLSAIFLLGAPSATAAAPRTPAGAPRQLGYGTPGAPTAVSVTPGKGLLSVAFSSPANPGLAPITNYEYSFDSGTTWVAPRPASTRSPMVISGLPNWTTYSVIIRAVNSYGPGPQDIAYGVNKATVGTSPAGGLGRDVAIAPDGTFAYVANYTGGTITRLRTSDNAITASIPMTGYLWSVAFSPDSAYAYVVGEQSDQIRRIRTSDNTIVDSHVLSIGAKNPLSVVVSPDGATLYVPDQSGRKVTLLNAANLFEKQTIEFADSVLSVAPTPDGASLLVTHGSKLARVNLATGLVVADVSLPGWAYQVRVSPDGKTALAVVSSTQQIVALSIPNLAVQWSVSDYFGPRSVGFAADGATFAVCGTDGWAMYRMDTHARVAGPTHIGDTQSNVAMDPSGRFVYIAISSERSVARIDLPAAPTSLVATAGDGQVVLSFTPPTAPPDAPPITNYATSIDGGKTWAEQNPATTSSPLWLGGLTNGTPLSLLVRARNALGWGAASSAVNATPSASAGAEFVPTAPTRVLDTRVTSGGTGSIPAGEPVHVYSVAAAQADGTPVVPAGATGIVANITVAGQAQPTVKPASAGHVRIMPGDQQVLTSASVLNFQPGQTIANAVTLKIDSQRRVAVYVTTPLDLIIDVVGYFAPMKVAGAAGASGRFTPVTPARVYDTAADGQGALASLDSRNVNVLKTQDGKVQVLPAAGVSAVAYNVTVKPTPSGGHLRVMPGDVAATAASAINWVKSGDAIANASNVRIDAAGRLRVYNGSAEGVQFTIDVVGYYSAPGGLFYSSDPTRVADTRSDGSGKIVGSGGQHLVTVATPLAGGPTLVPLGATAIAYNATATNTTVGGNLHIVPGGAPTTSASAISWPGSGYTRANASTVGISPQRQIMLTNDAPGGPMDAIVDILGYYKP